MIRTRLWKNILFWRRWLALCGLGLLALVRQVSAAPEASVSGIIVDESGMPMANATVRIQATTNSTLSGLDGTFILNGLEAGVSITVSAWKDHYYCAKAADIAPPASNLYLTLRLYQTNDNADYAWIPPAGANSCYSCKPGVTQIWLDNDAHARSGSNPRFLSLYSGTNITGTQQIAPGYKLDFPGTAGNCAACHAPGAALDAPFTTDMNLLPGIDADYGIHCDFCHKVADVYLNPATGLPYNNTPGVLSMDIRRPFPASPRYQLFFGSFDDDNVPEEDTYLPLIRKSQWCAPCHQFSFWGTPIYQSFKEWLESPYPQAGVECQTCHMPPDGIMTNVAPGMGGIERDPLTIHAHTMPGAASTALLQNTVAMSVTTSSIAGALSVTVTLTNYGAGHHVPTDHPGRQIILTVEAFDKAGQQLNMTSGGRIAGWGGTAAGLPGKIFAKILQDVVTGAFPVVSYWKQTLVLSDNRIPALSSDTSIYTFTAPPAGNEVTIRITLLFRRSFQMDMAARGWNINDIVLEMQELTLDTAAWWACYLPIINH